MSTEITRTGTPAKRRPFRNRNTILLPRELRDAIPDLHGGRILEVESIDGAISDSPWYGPTVSVKMVVAETGKLKGKFAVLLGLQPDAARALAETLMQLAKRLEG
jgi:hypothetical protein